MLMTYLQTSRQTSKVHFPKHITSIRRNLATGHTFNSSMFTYAHINHASMITKPDYHTPQPGNTLHKQNAISENK